MLAPIQEFVVSLLPLLTCGFDDRRTKEHMSVFSMEHGIT